MTTQLGRGERHQGEGTRGHSSGAEPEPEPVRALIEALVDEAALQGLLRTDRDDVLLDIEVDGLRCLVFLPVERSEAAASLSTREREIAQLVAAGWPNKTIAAELGISSWTVSTHLRRIFAKLGVRSRAAMVAQVVELGTSRVPDAPSVRLRTNP